MEDAGGLLKEEKTPLKEVNPKKTKVDTSFIRRIAAIIMIFNAIDFSSCTFIINWWLLVIGVCTLYSTGSVKFKNYKIKF